ncbi:LPS export ABC transporter periplasmic protein LptC [Candidatus Pelagibacter bacterium nBUS_28]|uniref:LPS export ABC transporter periplasmic protein LptC n=1 Tax=Candidatus Pelagibacter bacterium nBUS_28 TaxID=3374189 RepID=UPI003EBDAFCD
MKKKIFVKIILILSLIIISWFVYSKYFKEDENLLFKPLNPTTKNEGEAIYNSNIIKDINYSSKDLKGNEYILVAKKGEIDLDDSDIIFLTNVTAYIKLVKNSELIVINSDYGKYNTINYDTIFSKNVKIDYVDNIITGDYLDFSMMKNLLIISRNVVYKNLENTMRADVIELDTITKDTKIFMYNSSEQVNVTNIK